MITGVAGFIGSHAADALLSSPGNRVIGLDSLVYSGRLQNLPTKKENFCFIKCDISNSVQVNTALTHAKRFFSNEPYAVINFAAESHVDRSIQSGIPFVQTNVLGTQILLEFSAKLGAEKFLQVSTDEVYGSLIKGSATETFQLNPSSPYAASKASADLLALAFFHTHGFPITITRCVNNFGSRQLNEKLIPRFMYLASKNMDLPLYGTGQNIREWIPVSLHVNRILDVLTKGESGQIYNIGTDFRLSNFEIAEIILANFETESRIIYIEDRLGHDVRYAVNSQKGIDLFNWRSSQNIKAELEETMRFYWGIYKKMDSENLKKVEEVESFYN